MKKLTGKEMLHRAMQPRAKKVHKKTIGATLQGSYANPQERAFGGAGTKGLQAQSPMKLQGKKMKKHKKNWIAGAIKKPGVLHRELGVKAGDKIPTKKLNAAAGKSGLEGKRARLAQTLESFHHKHKKSMGKKSRKDLVQWAKEEEKEPEHKNKHRKMFTGGEKKATFDQKKISCKVCGKSHAKNFKHKA